MLRVGLEFFEELTGRTRDVHAAGDAALTVLDALYDAGGFGAFRAISALVGVHDLLAVAGLGNLRHCAVLLILECVGYGLAGGLDSKASPDRTSRNFSGEGGLHKAAPAIEGEDLRLRLTNKFTRGRRLMGQAAELPVMGIPSAKLPIH